MPKGWPGDGGTYHAFHASKDQPNRCRLCHESEDSHSLARRRLKASVCFKCGKEPIAQGSVAYGAQCLEKARLRMRKNRACLEHVWLIGSNGVQLCVKCGAWVGGSDDAARSSTSGDTDSGSSPAT